MDYTTHATLLVRLADGVDPDAWADFQRRYGDLIIGFARRYGLQASDCDDVAQDVLLALSQSMSDFRYDPARGKFRSFLRTLTMRTIFRRLRQKKASGVQYNIEAAESDAAADDQVEALWEDEWQRYHVRQAMARLEADFNEQDRMAFAHYAMQSMSAADTASALDMSVDQVYQAKSRILKRLTELVAEQASLEMMTINNTRNASDLGRTGTPSQLYFFSDGNSAAFT